MSMRLHFARSWLAKAATLLGGQADLVPRLWPAPRGPEAELNISAALEMSRRVQIVHADVPADNVMITPAWIRGSGRGRDLHRPPNGERSSSSS